MQETAEAGLGFSIVVPCFNEEQSIRSTVAELRSALSGSDPHEIILVNDGSTDGTGAIIHALAAELPSVVAVDHLTNLGYGAALKTGIRRSKAPLVAITDADGTYPIDRLPELVRACADVDMVVGARTAPDVEYSKIRAIPKVFLKAWASWIARQNIPDINSGMRVMKRDLVLKHFGILPNGFSFTLTITLASLTNFNTVLFLPISYKRRVGKSKIQPIRDTMRFMSIILRTGVYFAPLRAILPISAFLMILAGLSLIIDLIHQDMSDSTTILALFALNTGTLALIADRIEKRMK